jgi:hypothetical protein
MRGSGQAAVNKVGPDGLGSDSGAEMRGSMALMGNGGVKC